jgi:tRNA threonylcarbamoyladenosine biosynthesis protein TsaE
MRIDSHTEADTRAVGRRIAALVRPGDVVLVGGRLGAGKTVFVSGIAEGLGIDDPVTSPSFVLVRSYDGFLPLIHADAYRLQSSAELEDLGLNESAVDGVLVIEWGDVFESAFGDDALLVRLEVGDGGTRTISIEARGSWKTRALEDVA